MLAKTVALFLASLATSAGAQEPDIVVTGHGLEQAPGEAAYDIVAIDRERLLQSASGRLEDALRDVAGLQSFRRSDSRSSHATNQGITLRGLGGNASSRALLLLDGVPQADPFGGWISFPAYATDRIGSVRVTRGGGSGYWGPGALAGTVEIDSAAPGELAPAAGALAYGSRDSLDARASLAFTGARGFATVAGAFARGDGFIPIIARDRGPVDRPAPFRQGSAAIRTVFAVATDTEAQLNLSGFRDRRERGLDFTVNRGEGLDGSVRLVGKGRTRWSLLGYVQTREFASQFAAVNAARTAVTPTLDQDSVPSRGIGARGEIVPFRGPLELRLGGDVRAVDGETRELFMFVAGSPTRRRKAGGQALTAGLFADASWTRGSLLLSLGGRIDRWRIHDGHLRILSLTGQPPTDTAFASRSGWEPTGRIGLAWRGSRSLKLRAAAYRGWRLPTLNELYRPFRVGAESTAANAALDPETMIGGEAGIDFSPKENVRLSLTGFVSRLDDAIANVTLAPNSRQRQNLESIRSRGIELDAAGRFGDFGLRASYALTDARVQASGLAAPLDGLRPAQTPRHHASATIDWRGPWQSRLALTGRWIARQFEDDGNRRSLDPATTLDAFVAVPITDRLAIEARGENLFDRRVEATVASDGVIERALPRTVWLGLRLR